jgi:hypothetical protein
MSGASGSSGPALGSGTPPQASTNNIKNLTYFYDGQIRRYLEQIVRAFSGWQYNTGGSSPLLTQVPCTMALSNSMVANIINNNSENAMPTCPMITVSLTNLRGRREDVQDPNFVDHRQVVERQIVNGVYTGNRGNSYTVDRIMPMPFEMQIQVDIWTSNIDQKLQLLEQILTVIYPSFDIQSSVNALDWTALTTVYVEDIIYTSRTLPVGANANELEIASINLKLPIWITAPAKVKRQTLINQIITNVYAAEEISGLGYINGDAGIREAVTGLEQGAELLQVIVTPGNYAIKVSNGIITLIPNSMNYPALSWQNLIYEYGNINPGISQIRLYDTFNSTNYIAGTIQLTSNPNQLEWTLIEDTLPTNTLNEITAVINPTKTFPGNGLTPTAGSTYLILEEIEPCEAWGNLTAAANDIIEYDGSNWSILFNAATNGSTVQYVINSYSGTQLKFINEQWILSVDQTYQKGYWELVLVP